MTTKPSIVKVLKHYGADRVPEGRGWRAMRCPFHDDTNASASVNNGEAFHCHACGVSGDALKIIMEQESCDFPTALKLAEDMDTDYKPEEKHTRSGRPVKTRRWSPPGRRGRQPW